MEDRADGASDRERSTRGHYHCGMGSCHTGMDRICEKMMKITPRAMSLLEEALDWVGAINITEQEEVLAHCLQRRIARLLAEARE